MPALGGAGASYSGRNRETLLRVLIHMKQQKTVVDFLDPDQSDDSLDHGVGPIRACVAEALATYFRQLNGHTCDGLYKLVLAEVELPLLESVMNYCGGNQTRAAQVLGLNRGTLRKKLQQYGLDQ